MGRLQAYVLTRMLAGVGGALAILGSLVMLISFVELSRRFGARVSVGFFQLVGLMLLQSPSIILQLLPFVFLFGSLAAFVTMNRRSELVAMRAAGVSAWRFIFPAAGIAFLIGVVTVVALNPMAAALNSRFETDRIELTEGHRSVGEAHELWLRQGDERTQIVIHAKDHDMQGGAVRLRGVSLFVQSITPSGGVEFTRRIEAAEARLDPGFWRLSDVREAAPGAASVRSETLSIPSTLDRGSAMEKFAPAGTVGFWALPVTIKRAEQAGLASSPYRLLLQQLLAAPLLFSAMTILAAAFSLRLMRLGGLAGLSGIGIALGFAIFFFNQFCGQLGASEVIPPVIAAWAPPLVALLSGFTLISYTEDG
ncbi:MAG: LPS export ABC transporter permease LptG [Caulobacterales bacterium]